MDIDRAEEEVLSVDGGRGGFDRRGGGRGGFERRGGRRGGFERRGEGKRRLFNCNHSHNENLSYDFSLPSVGLSSSAHTHRTFVCRFELGPE